MRPRRRLASALLALLAAAGCSDAPTAPPVVPSPTPTPTATPAATHPWPISGDYRLSITLGAACQRRVLPRFHHRVWDISITPAGERSTFQFSGPENIWIDDRATSCQLCGFLGGPPVNQVSVRATFTESLETFWLSYDLFALNAHLEGETISGTAGGAFHQVEFSSEARVDCDSTPFDFALTPR